MKKKRTERQPWVTHHRHKPLLRRVGHHGLNDQGTEVSPLVGDDPRSKIRGAKEVGLVGASPGGLLGWAVHSGLLQSEIGLRGLRELIYQDNKPGRWPQKGHLPGSLS
jgi:hypothetical protein